MRGPNKKRPAGDAAQRAVRIARIATEQEELPPNARRRTFKVQDLISGDAPLKPRSKSQ